MLNQLISSKELLLQQAVQEEEKRRQKEAARIAPNESAVRRICLLRFSVNKSNSGERQSKGLL